MLYSPKLFSIFNWDSVGAGCLTPSNGLVERLVGGVTEVMPNGLIEVGGGNGAMRVSKLTRGALEPKKDSSTEGF